MSWSLVALCDGCLREQKVTAAIHASQLAAGNQIRRPVLSPMMECLVRIPEVGQGFRLLDCPEHPACFRVDIGLLMDVLFVQANLDSICGIFHPPVNKPL